MPQKKTLFDAMDHYMDQRRQDNMTEATITSLTPTGARIQLKGSGNSQDASIMGDITLNRGDTVLAVRPVSSLKWIVMGRYTAPQSGTPPNTPPAESFELFPPSNIRSEQLVPGCVTVAWDAPAQALLLFEVQSSPDGSEIGVINEVYTRGSYAILNSDEAIYVRVRSRSETFTTSTWSEWILATPRSISSQSLTLDAAVTWCSEILSYNNSVIGYVP